MGVTPSPVSLGGVGLSHLLPVNPVKALRVWHYHLYSINEESKGLEFNLLKVTPLASTTAPPGLTDSSAVFTSQTTSRSHLRLP